MEMEMKNEVMLCDGCNRLYPVDDDSIVGRCPDCTPSEWWAIGAVICPKCGESASYTDRDCDVVECYSDACIAARRLNSLPTIISCIKDTVVAKLPGYSFTGLPVKDKYGRDTYFINGDNTICFFVDEETRINLLTVTGSRYSVTSPMYNYKFCEWLPKACKTTNAINTHYRSIVAEISNY